MTLRYAEQVRPGPTPRPLFDATVTAGGRRPVVLLVASPGGHIDELKLFVARLGLAECDLVWVTTKTPQTEGLLSEDTVHWVPGIASNEIGKALITVPQALRLQARLRPDLVVSTGAAQATPHLLAAATRLTQIWFIESATRLDGPSKTGALAQRLRNTRLFVQGAGWGNPRWQSVEDVFDSFEVAPGSRRPVHSAVVSLGSERFPFDRAYVSASQVLSDCDVYWQTGSTPAPAGVRSWAPGNELRSACASSDVVVTHAGIGSILMSLGAGRVPIVLARERSRGEHIDDHQLQIARELEERGLVVRATPDSLSWEHVERAASLSVRSRLPIDAAPVAVPIPRAS